ncbi:LysR family transcriptional regulator [Mesorhizobium xinjiangense]|uniref:LysR family transcriptional regulator n=1 Tax=Mesorhizobium xinjiangense TaxID=2678685 RepID=UPI0012ED1E6A|nr:LysR family transcriptional regulator [Mesorhizobium xinjiangense]
MTLLVDIKAFLATARNGSFSAAAREIGLAPSVVTKRVGRLEDHLGIQLFVRSTRMLVMTSDADRLRPRLQLHISQLEETLAGGQAPEHGIAGHLRIKAPTTLGTLFAGRSIARFQAENPAVTTDLMLIDRSVNPLEEGFDIALGALPQSYASVVEVPLCPYPRVLVATPEYLEQNGVPQAPGDLVAHRCIVYVAAGITWFFESASGPLSVTVNPVFTVNDSRLLHFAARHHIGIAVAPAFLVQDEVADGRMVHLLPDYPVAPLWFKAMVPSNKMHRPDVAALLARLKADFEIPPWEIDPVPAL